MPKKKKNRDAGNASSKKRGWPDVANTAITTCINKGQLPLILILVIFLTAAWRMPANSLGEISGLLVKHFVDFSIVGWTLAVAIAIWHITTTKSMRKKFHEEIDRVSEKRNSLQNEQSGKAVIESSKRPLEGKNRQTPHSNSNPNSSKSNQGTRSDAKHN